MPMMTVLQGICIGLVFGVPIGAIGTLVIRRTLAEGVLSGFITGLGCSTADLFYACITVFGFTVFSDFLLFYQRILSIVGGLFIITLGIFSFIKKPKEHKEISSGMGLLRNYGASFLIALTNPATILTFVMAFSVFAVKPAETVMQGVALIIGILIGTCIWWSVLSITVGALRKKINESLTQKLYRILAVMLVAFGIVVLVGAIYQ